MDLLRALAARVQRGLGRRPLPAPTNPGLAAAEPDRRHRRAARPRLQHRVELRHEHELAELRRRVDDEPSHADGRADGPELRVGGSRPHRRGRARARAHSAPLGDDRELLGRPHSLDDARLAARSPSCSLSSSQARASCSRCAAGTRNDRPGRDADDLARSGREPGGDQGARNERRRPGQRELRAPLREPDPLHEPPADARAPEHPLRAHVCVRPPGREPEAGLGDLRGDVRLMDRLRRDSDPLRGERQSASSTPSARARPLGNMEGKEVRFGPAATGTVRGHDDRHLDRRGDRRTRQLHAARRRRSARQHDARRGLARAASAPASTGC